MEAANVVFRVIPIITVQSRKGPVCSSTIKNKRHSARCFKTGHAPVPATVRTNTHVKSILIEDGRAVGVEVMTAHSDSERINCNREVVLSAGYSIEY